MKKITGIKRLFPPDSLRTQLLSRYLGLIALLLIVIGFFQYFLMRDFIYKNKAESIQSQIIAVPNEAWGQTIYGMSDSMPAPGPNRFHFFIAPDAKIAVIDENGNYSVFADSTAGGEMLKLTPEEYKAAMFSKKRLNYKVINDSSGHEQLLVLQPIGRGHVSGLVQVSINTKPLTDLLVGQLVVFLLLSVLALGAGLLAFIPVLKKTLVPLSNMIHTAEEIDAGNLTKRFPVHQGQMEIDRLSESFNGMLERLQISFEAEKEAKEQMRRFVADASHELRTPLTSIHGFLEVLLRGAMKDSDKLQKSLKSMFAESERMKKLVQDLLLLAKMDRSPKIELSEGELDLLLMDMETQLRLLAGNRKVTLELTPHLSCLFNEDKIKQVVLNLFHNAVQHTDPILGQIAVSLTKVTDGIELAVRDNGSGIPEEHQPHLFERFYRIDSSRTRKYGGSGLGLSITKSIIDLHGGSIRVESQPDKGSVFYVYLPSSIPAVF
ncbi:MAG: HAMP domain-containing protein [Peptococcaceae bacterium]|nr:HAMP domain-containing protein [Peptococcaceae bacterium]